MTPTVALREALRLRIDGLRDEVAAWLLRARREPYAHLHDSQYRALAAVMQGVDDRLRAVLAAALPDGDEFLRTASALDARVVQAHRTWSFYRERFEQRYGNDSRDVLLVADMVAQDCYLPVIQRAVAAGIVAKDAVREPPLVHLAGGLSSAIWVRGSRPTDGRDYVLGTATLPIPVVEVPRDRASQPWELLSVAHEVAHDFEADLMLRGELQSSLKAALTARGTPELRVVDWLRWQAEVFADLVALQLVGLGYVDALLSLAAMLPDRGDARDPDDPHPPARVRVPLALAHAATLVQDDGAARVATQIDELQRRWKPVFPVDASPYDDDFDAVSTALLDAPLDTLKGATVRSLMPFSAKDLQRIDAVAQYLATGAGHAFLGRVELRHYASAAQRAFHAIPDGEPVHVARGLSDIRSRVREEVLANLPDVPRSAPVRTSRPLIDRFVDRLLE